MGVAPDATSVAVTQGGGPASPINDLTFTVGSGLNRVLLVGIAFDQSTGVVGSLVMHWDSLGTNQLMFNIVTSGIDANKGQTWLFGLRNPTSGLKTLNITFTGTPLSYCLGYASFTGADQAADLTTFKNAIGSIIATDADPYIATVNSPVNDMAIAYFGSLNSGFGVANTGTIFGNSNTNVSASGIFLAGAGASTVLSTSVIGTGFAASQVGCDIAAVSAAAAAKGGTMPMMGMG